MKPRLYEDENKQWNQICFSHKDSFMYDPVDVPTSAASLTDSSSSVCLYMVRAAVYELWRVVYFWAFSPGLRADFLTTVNYMWCRISSTSLLLMSSCLWRVYSVEEFKVTCVCVLFGARVDAFQTLLLCTNVYNRSCKKKKNHIMSTETFTQFNSANCWRYESLRK